MTTSVEPGFAQRWERWRSARERTLADPHGWLALVSLDWLDETPRQYPGVPGRWWQDAEAANVDPAAPAPAAFHGVPTYDPDPAWVLRGHFEPFESPRPTTVGAVVEGLSHVYVAPGLVHFEHGGVSHTLTAFNGKTSGLDILFTDETSGVTTYAANRSLSAAVAADGTVTLDFNRATNLPCAFTDFATCPLPPAGNHLPFAVTAGEQTPYERSAD